MLSKRKVHEQLNVFIQSTGIQEIQIVSCRRLILVARSQGKRGASAEFFKGRVRKKESLMKQVYYPIFSILVFMS